MTDKKLAAIAAKMTISDMAVMNMILCDILGVGAKEYEQKCPEEFSRFLTVKQIFEENCNQRIRAGGDPDRRETD